MTKFKKIIPYALAGITLLLIVIMVAKNPFLSSKTNYRVVCIGDSIIGNTRDETSVTTVMENRLGYKVYNGAFGGTCASKSNIENRPTFYEDSINLCELAEAISYQDFGVQLFDIDSNNFKLDYFSQVLRDLSKIDFDQVEILFIEHGINDYNAGRPLDNPENPYDVFTFGGALRYSIEQLQQSYPDLHIVLTTPLYCYFQKDGERLGDSITSDFGYGPLENYVNLEIQIAREYGIGLLDNFHELGINESNMEEYAEDGIHLNELGRKVLGEAMAKYVESYFTEKE